MNTYRNTLAKAALLSAAVGLVGGAGAASDTSPQTDEPGTAAPAMGGSDMAMMPMQSRIQRMQEQMGKLRSTQDPEQRTALLREHMKSMQEAMSTMHGMMAGQHMMGRQRAMTGPGTMGPGVMGYAMRDPCFGRWPGTGPGPTAGSGADTAERLNMMEQRMNMMQMMMDQMLENQSEQLDEDQGR